jgi:tetratricopeptide (TPR) repeat protein
MKRLLLIAALVFAPAMLASLATAQTAGAQPAAQDPKAEEAAAYKAWYDANGAKDFAKAMELAKAYVEKYPGGQNVAYLKEKWIPSTRTTLFNQAIGQKNMNDMIRIGREVLADNPDNLDYLIAMSVQLRTNELFATPPNFALGKDAAEFTERAMKLIDSGKTPTPNPSSPFDKNKTIAFFEQTLAVIDDHNKNIDKALERYQRAGSLDPMSPLYFFHVGRLNQEKYLAAAKKYQDLPEADRDASPPSAEVKAALDDVNKYADGVINGWLRYLGLTADKPTTGDTRSKVESVVTELYKFRNNNTIEGLAKLVEQNKTSPTPVSMPAPVAPPKTTTEQKPAEPSAAANGKPAAKKP